MSRQQLRLNYPDMICKKCCVIKLRLIITVTIKVKQTKSRIKCPKDQKRTLDALGLKKMNQVVEHEATPAILGMVEKVKHLVSVVK